MSWLVTSNLYVSLCAASLIWVSYVSLGVPLASRWPPPPSVWLVFFATLLVYNLDRLAPSVEDAPLEAGPSRQPRRRGMWGMLLLGALGTAITALFLRPILILALAPAALLAIGYSLPLFYWRGEFHRLKSLPGLKIFLIALVWSLATVVIPAWEARISPMNLVVTEEATLRLLFIFAIALPFDVRDMARDQRAGILTLPHVLGVRGTRRVAIGALLLHALLLVAAHGHEPTLAVRLLPPALLATALTAALIARLTPERSERYYTVYMEGTMALYSALVLLWQLAW